MPKEGMVEPYENHAIGLTVYMYPSLPAYAAFRDGEIGYRPY